MRCRLVVQTNPSRYSFKLVILAERTMLDGSPPSAVRLQTASSIAIDLRDPSIEEFEVENRTYPSLASFPYGRSMDLGFPEWVGAQPFDSDVQAIYASEGALPMILPLKPEKVELAVKVAS
ncbi:hypothetical protein POTOM_056600 [Populus tomentosa]|uniref:Uncharacterized protein n=1 Tax=Populus tomentosa TaxID=118781 RepID=A0A8X8C4Q2_POPTO|nr:hypothetical protein POTOM_056600 [Populus tomentosa]